MQKKIILAFLFSLLFFKLNAQQTTVTLKITNSKNDPVANASIKIINWPDSSTIQKKIADSSGVAVVSLSKNIKYSIVISAIDHLPFEKGINFTGNQTYFKFVLEPANKNLDTTSLHRRHEAGHGQARQGHA